MPQPSLFPAAPPFATPLSSRLNALPAVRINAKLVQQPLDERPVDIATVRVGNGEFASPLAHDGMPFARVRAVPAQRPKPPDHFPVANRLGHRRAGD